MPYRPNQTPLFASFDGEFDGPNPVQHSMRSLGVALFESGNPVPIATFYVTMKPQKHAVVHEKTKKEFLDLHPDVWKEINTNNIEIPLAMEQFSDFLKKHNRGRYLYVASPSCVDWMFLTIYYNQYGPADRYDIGFYCHDLSQYIRIYITMNAIKNEQAFHSFLLQGNCYGSDHHALHDAIHQGIKYVTIRNLINDQKMVKEQLHFKSRKSFLLE